MARMAKHSVLRTIGWVTLLTACHRDRALVSEAATNEPSGSTTSAVESVEADAGSAVDVEEAEAAAWDAKFESDEPLSSSEHASAEQPIVDALAKVDALTAKEPVECRLTRCRVVVQSQSGDNLERAFGVLFGAPGPHMAAKPLIDRPIVISRRVEGGNGSISATIYIARGSHVLQL